MIKSLVGSIHLALLLLAWLVAGPLQAEANFNNSLYLLGRDTGTTDPNADGQVNDIDNFDNAAFQARLEDPSSVSPDPLSQDAIAAITAATAESIQFVEQGKVPSPSGDGSVDTAPSPDMELIEIQTSGGKYVLSSGSDSNFHLSAVGSDGTGVKFQSMENIAVLTDQLDFMWYYPATIATDGVSRFRTGPGDKIPVGSKMVTLIPINAIDASEPDTPQVGTYSAVDGDGNVFYPVVCSYVNPNIKTKVFLVKDVKDGVAKLKSKDVLSTVTGSLIKDCGYMPFVSPGFKGLGGGDADN